MNKLILHNGGHPFKIDNLNHISEAIAMVVDAIMKSASPGSIGLGCRMWGCEPTLSNGGNTVDVTAGYVCLFNGSEYEICAVDAHQVTKGNTQVFRWIIHTSYLPIDPQTYADTNTHNVHQVNKAVLEAGTLGFGDVIYNVAYWSDLVNGAKWSTIQAIAGNFLTDDEPTVDWDITGATVDALIGSDNKVRHVNVLVQNSEVTGGNATVLKVKLPHPASSSSTGVAWISGFDFCICTVNAGSDELGILAISGGIPQNITGSLVVVRAAITYEVA